MNAPTLTDANVTLRPQQAGDFDAYFAFRQNPRAEHMGLKRDRLNAWFAFLAESGSCSLYGMGAWSVEVDGALAGQISVMQPPHFPETEIGWFLFDEFEGRGLAYSAAKLALDYTWDQIKPSSLVSYIDQNNHRSIALSQRLGAQLDPDAAKYDEVDVVYRHTDPRVTS